MIKSDEGKIEVHGNRSEVFADIFAVIESIYLNDKKSGKGGAIVTRMVFTKKLNDFFDHLDSGKPLSLKLDEMDDRHRILTPNDLCSLFGKAIFAYEKDHPGFNGDELTEVCGYLIAQVFDK